MGYDDETGRPRRGQSRARQPVKRTGTREPEYRRERRDRYEESYGELRRSDNRYESSQYRGKEINLITDTFHRAEQNRERSRGSSFGREGTPSLAARQTAAAKHNPPKKTLSKQEKTKQGNSGAYHTPEQKKAQKRKRRLLIIMVEIMALVSVLVFAAFTYLNKSIGMIQRLPWNPSDIKNVEISEEKQEQMTGYWTIAVFGVDSRNSSVGKGNNSDVNMICNINQATGEIKLVSVFRDTYLNISDKNSYNKINAAYLQGGPEQSVKALNKNLDLDIDDYVTFNWKAVADGINILGGIDLELSKAEFYYINAFVTETVKATGVPSAPVKHAGMVHLDGVQAVAYGRLRLMDTDYARTERQRKIVALAFEKAKTADWAMLNNIIQTVFPQVATSVEIGDVLKMGRDIGRLHLGETAGFPTARGDANMGSKGACVIPQTLETNVTLLHKFLFDDENYETTDTVKTISRKIISDTGLAKDAKPIDHVNTSGGNVPKTTKTDEETVESSTEDRESQTEHESGESETTKGNKPGNGWTQYETDSEGNWIEATGESQTGAVRPGTSTTKPDTTKPGTTKPGTTQPETTKPEASKPGTTQTTEAESASQKPGSGNTGGSNIPGGSTNIPGGSSNAPGGSSNAPGGSSNVPGGGSNAPGGGSTDTGVILGPGNNSSNAPGGNIEFSGPMGP